MSKVAEAKAQIYINSANYREEYVHTDGKQCYIFFSSNGLYDDNSVEEIEQILVEKDRYEWKNLANSFKYHRDLGKIIYVRDIYKAFYIYGINEQLNSVDKVIEKLKELTTGYEVTTVGISSGGYLAVISGVALEAKRVFCFSGQFDIAERLLESDFIHCKSVEEKKKYINIVNLIKQNPSIPIYYFCPIGCQHDYDNYMWIKDIKNVRSFLFPDKIHAATVYPFNFPDLLFETNVKLDKLNKVYQGRTINKKSFYIKTVTVRGFFTLVAYIWRTRFRIELLKKRWDV